MNPETAAPRRSIAALDPDGNFTLDVEIGEPYVFVFVDNAAVGADMAVAVFRAETLDTLAPQLASHLDLGETEVDPDTQTATSSVPYAELVAGLGLSEAAPDIDGDGVLELEQDRRLALAFTSGPRFVAAGRGRCSRSTTSPISTCRSRARTSPRRCST